MSIQARTHRPRGGTGRGVAARSGRRGGKAGRRQLPLGLRARCRSHTPRGEEPGGRTEARPPPARAAPGSPAVPPAGAASSPLGGSGSPGARSRTALPATPRRSPLPPAERLVRSVLLQSSPLVSGGRGRELPLPRGKGRSRRGRFSELRALPGQPLLAAGSAASVVFWAALG